MPKISRGKKKAPKPFWQSGSFIFCASVVVLSIILTLEPVAVMVDDYFGTTTSNRALQQQHRRLGGMNEAAERHCQENPGTCTEAPEDIHTSFQVHLINKSVYRADIHWDNDSTGQVISNIEAGASLDLTVFPANKFFITRHGVKEGLFDPLANRPLRFEPTKVGQTFVIPENAAPSDDKCIDRFDKACQDYAKAGKCWEQPGWMIVHCCQSCNEYSPELDAARLIDGSVRCTKENMNITEPVWKPGDLDALFTKWANDPEFKQFQPNVLSSPDQFDANGLPQPWVITFDNFFSQEEAQALIEGGRMAGFDRSTNQGKTNDQGEMEMVTSTTRTSSNAWCIGDCQQLPGVRTMTKRIEQVTGIEEKNYEPFQVLEYQDKQFYKMHHDSEGRDPKPPGNRILTFFLYLSNVEEGGETQFNKLGIYVKPKLGRALVWPSVRNESPDFWDDRMYHEAMPVVRGEKYAANHWIHLNDYEGPNRWGCTGSFA
ncbi:Prolyl 4-hydroxylase subunit alpha-2 [Seminavis robusta]|uniref:Prolyl 4-hydroxylase subunit alpha-2 n=1 Tax=Seminavis robusta TaxID=568900 RepID=A0A9N8HUF5_9STRA|nr:Prolyl 4-hydroxylase subunit alpha-2 [Seminavis robusta]|eukprot:Sro1743_g294760.1 Prolyl 4-hydroxylase subunit alpha-2 (487) ;mRNA; f:7272-8732